MRSAEISKIWIDSGGRLCVSLADASRTLEQIYRASASGVHWDAGIQAICSPVPREWSYADWFVRITEDVRDEYGIDLVVSATTTWQSLSPALQTALQEARSRMPPHQRYSVDRRTMAKNVGDDRRRQEARDLFKAQQWKAVVAKLDSIQFPEFLEEADRKRLEIARRRDQSKQ